MSYDVDMRLKRIEMIEEEFDKAVARYAYVYWTLLFLQCMLELMPIVIPWTWD